MLLEKLKSQIMFKAAFKKSNQILKVIIFHQTDIHCMLHPICKWLILKTYRSTTTEINTIFEKTIEKEKYQAGTNQSE